MPHHRRQRASSCATATSTGPSSARSPPAQGITIDGTVIGAVRDRSARPARRCPSGAASARAPCRWPPCCCRSALPAPAACLAFARRRGRNDVYAGGAADAAFGPGEPAAARQPAARRHAGRRRPHGRPRDDRVRAAARHRAVGRLGAAARADRRRHRRRLVLRARGARRPDDHQGPRRRAPRRARPRAARSSRRRRRTGRSWSRCSAAPTPSSSTATTRTSPPRGARRRPRWPARSRASGYWKRRPPGSRHAGRVGAPRLRRRRRRGVRAARRRRPEPRCSARPARSPSPSSCRRSPRSRCTASCCRRAAPPGSALALRTESFRRFLAASEGRHVQWAWEHGLLREYSAWAVALGDRRRLAAGDGAHRASRRPS